MGGSGAEDINIRSKERGLGMGDDISAAKRQVEEKERHKMLHDCAAL